MARAPGTTNGIRDPRAVTQPIEPGSLNLAHDVDDQNGTHWRLGDGLERRSDEVGLARGTRLREPLPDEREQHERDADTCDCSRARDGDWHRAIVAANASTVVHVSVKRLRQVRWSG